MPKPDFPVAQININRSIDIRLPILIFMVAVYPLIVIPNTIGFAYEGSYKYFGYFYGPKYVALCAVSLTALYFLIKNRPSLKNPVFIPLLFFVAFLLISAFMAPDQLTAWIGVYSQRYTGASTYLFCIILFILAKDCEKADIIMNYMLITASIVSLLGILQYFGINLVPHEPFRDAYISYGTIIYPNFFGTYTSFILPAATLNYIRMKSVKSLIYASLIYGGLLVSLCRGTWIAAFIVFVVIVIYVFKNKKERKALYKLAGTFIFITFALLPVRDFSLLKRIFSFSGELEKGIALDEAAGTSRFFIWKETFKLFQQSWLFGIGPDNLFHARIISPLGELIDKAHNIYLEIATTMGIFALISYLAFLSNFIKRWKNDQGFIYFTMILVYLIQGFSNIDVIAIMPLFWIILGLSLANSSQLQTQQSKTLL